MKRLCAMVLTFALAWSVPARALELHGIRPDEIAVWAAPVEGDSVLEAYRAEQAVNPASTMKLLTGWSALTRLTPDYRWRTELVSNAPLAHGVLQGDLYWIGAGDPRFANRDLQGMLRTLRARGIERIAGRLLLDKRAFSRIGSASDFGGDAARVFMVDPDTHLTGLKVAWLRFFNDGNGARVTLDPPLAGVRLNAVLSDGGEGLCDDVRRLVSIQVEPERISVSGALPRSCDGAQSYVNVLDHDQYAAQAFAALWRELGGSGPLGSGRGTAPADARVLASHDSEPLPVALADINKYSNNTMARALYLTLGRVAGGCGDTVADAERAVRQTLADAGIAAAPLVLENGAGLSRRERVSARLLGEVLQNAARGPYAGEFLASLPLAAADGTLKKRFAQLGPRLRLKTGTLDGVRSLAGYWQAADGRRLAIVAIVNSPRAAELMPALDRVVADLVTRFDPAAGVRREYNSPITPSLPVEPR
ncbi:D-alanyl-D-alanine carboxypeptidase/D-alanyl-D-alanine-endopeptidase [Pseudogulbenkiania sp. MAI-1]|uniref:D-alanyl-D-alanine carboxypeptidase/D-alanyl-D-alanine endopeptidase n=1 Tax=Pseudogulbenkiania sp. MAI-1 TaxID=990370 RepID=UPI00045EC6EE|nr:D-alanyl-D-alanine carboxypeptidase/D-alanyl-D-alanine-endopeptidase [Pseudogulbenkiania sp. MAI-1]